MRKGRGFWQGHVDGWKRSELSGRAYCRRESLSPYGLKYWARKLREEGSTGGLVEISGSVVQGAGRTRSTMIELVVEGRYLLRLHADTTKEHLVRVLDALERRL
jgi:hypothetical protein